jgi:hypothetical protein
MDQQTQRAIRELASLLTGVQHRVGALERTRRAPQLGHSSIEQGALEVRDPETGARRLRIGWVDGAAAVVTEGGDPVSAPTAPSVTPSLGGLRVTWDGTLANELSLPPDFDHMAVHVSTTSGFTPSAATYVGSIRRAGDGGMLPVVPLPYVEHFVRLVPVTTGGVQGAPSAETAATPLQVDGADLTVGSVTAPIIAAGAVEADKLEAILVLASTIIAGIPGAARVELDQDGLRGYNTDNELIFAVDAEGNAVFSGDIVASTITGSSMVVGAAPGAVGQIDADTTRAIITMTAPNQTHAQLQATADQAEFAAFSDRTDPNSAGAGFIALPTGVTFTLSSDNADTASPGVAGAASAANARLVVRSQRDNPTASQMSVTADDTRATLSMLSTDGASIHVDARTDTAQVLMMPPPQPDATPQAEGVLYALTTTSANVPAVQVIAPRTTSGTGATKRAGITLTGANAGAPTTTAYHNAKDHSFAGGFDGSTVNTTEPGSVALASTHTLYAPAHQPVRTDLAAQPTGSGNNGVWTDFTSGQYPTRPFTTGRSGWVRITITMCGVNNATGGSTLAVGFRLTGGSTVEAALSRAAMVRARQFEGTTNTYGVQQSTPVYLQLAANADYTLTPAWRASGSAATWGTDADSDIRFDLGYDNSIVVEPLM